MVSKTLKRFQNIYLTKLQAYLFKYAAELLQLFNLKNKFFLQLVAPGI
jgi:hypothetical protein